MKILKYLIFCFVLIPIIKRNSKLQDEMWAKTIVGSPSMTLSPDDCNWAYDLAYKWNYNVRIETGLVYVNELLRCKVCNDVLDDDEDKYIGTMCTDCCRSKNYITDKCKTCAQIVLCEDPDFDISFSKYAEGNI